MPAPYELTHDSVFAHPLSLALQACNCRFSYWQIPQNNYAVPFAILKNPFCKNHRFRTAHKYSEHETMSKGADQSIEMSNALLN